MSATSSCARNSPSTIILAVLFCIFSAISWIFASISEIILDNLSISVIDSLLLLDLAISVATSFIPFEIISSDSPSKGSNLTAAFSISIDERSGYPPILKNSAAAFG
jgi:hypothetical protein